MDDADKRIESRDVGPFRFWRGYTSTPRPWPRLLYVERIGWMLVLDTMAVGVQLRGPDVG